MILPQSLRRSTPAERQPQFDIELSLEIALRRIVGTRLIFFYFRIQQAQSTVKKNETS